MDQKYSAKARLGTGGPFTDEESEEWFSFTMKRFFTMVKRDDKGMLCTTLGDSTKDEVVFKAIAYLNEVEKISLIYDNNKPVTAGYFSQLLDKIERGKPELMAGEVFDSKIVK